MEDIIIENIKNLKIAFEKVPGDNMNMILNISWKQSFQNRKSEDISVYLLIGGYKNHSYRLQRSENSDLWYTALKIKINLFEISTFDNKITLRITDSNTDQTESSYSYAS